MTIERDPTRVVRSWLEEGPTALPDHVLDAVLDQLPATPQRRAPGPAWRIRQMNASTKFLLAAAVTAVALAGLSVPLLTSSPGPGSSVTPSASPTTEPSPGASPAPSPLAYTWPTALQAGTYSTRFVWDAPVRFTFTVPDGWQGMDVEVIKEAQGVGLMFALVDNVYADPCGHVLMDPPVGPSVADLVQALWGLPGTTPLSRDVSAGQPTPTSLAGYEGETFTFTVREDPGCPSSSYFMWDAPPDSMQAGLPSGGSTFYSERANHHMWVIDVGGTDVGGIRYLVDASWSPDATQADLDELQTVVDSIRIERTTDPSSLGACTLEFTEAANPSVPLQEPYTVTMRPTRYPVRGPAPVDDNGEPLTPAPPIAQIDWTGEGWAGGAGLIGPDGAEGFTTHTGVNGPQGSMVFDAPGTWLVSFDDGPESRCFRQFPVEVLPPAS